jgi:pimeloyl-ACP methyl ester carboxylesterase
VSLAVVSGFEPRGRTDRAVARAAHEYSTSSADEEEVRAWARVFRYGSSPGAWEALYRVNMAIDVRDVLPLVSAPTLALHQRGDPWVRVDHGRYLAQHIRGAAYVELDGDEHLFHRCSCAGVAGPGDALPP